MATFVLFLALAAAAVSASPELSKSCLHSIYDHIHTEVLPLETAQAGVAAADRDLQAAKRNLEVLETQLGESMLSCAKGGPDTEPIVEALVRHFLKSEQLEEEYKRMSEVGDPNAAEAQTRYYVEANLQIRAYQTLLAAEEVLRRCQDEYRGAVESHHQQLSEQVAKAEAKRERAAKALQMTEQVPACANTVRTALGELRSAGYGNHIPRIGLRVKELCEAELGASLDAEQRGKFCHLESSSFMLTLEHAESTGGDFDAAVEKATHQACADAMAPEELLERMGAGIEKLMEDFCSDAEEEKPAEEKPEEGPKEEAEEGEAAQPPAAKEEEEEEEAPERVYFGVNFDHAKYDAHKRPYTAEPLPECLQACRKQGRTQADCYHACMAPPTAPGEEPLPALHVPRPPSMDVLRAAQRKASCSRQCAESEDLSGFTECVERCVEGEIEE